MKVKGLKTGLETLALVLGDWEASRASGELQKLIALMEGHEEMSVDAFCKKARQGLDGPTHIKVQDRVKGTNTSGLRRSIVDQHMSALKQANISDVDFSQALIELSDDKAVRLKELKVIAGEFMGVHPLASKKNDIIEEIKTKRAQDLRTVHKFKILTQR